MMRNPLAPALAILGTLAVTLSATPGAAAPVRGLGTPTYIPFWSASDSLTNSNLFHRVNAAAHLNGNIGIGTTTPLGRLGIQGHNSYEIYGHDAGQVFNIYSEGDMALLPGPGKYLRLGSNGTNDELVVQNGTIRLNSAAPPTGTEGKIYLPGTIGYEIYGAGAGQTMNMYSEGDMALLTAANKTLHFGSGGVNSRMVLTGAGAVGIGTLTPDAAYKLSVNGKIRAKEVVVNTGWADFVFEPGYELMGLEQLQRSIQENRRLPGMPSTAEVEKDGIGLGELQGKFLQKIEELTLYVLELKRENDALRNRVSTLEQGDDQ